MNTEQPKQVEDARAKAYSVAATQYRKDRRQAFLTAEENRAFKSGFKAGYAAARSEGWISVEDRLPTEPDFYEIWGEYSSPLKNGETFEHRGFEWFSGHDFRHAALVRAIAWREAPPDYRKIEPPSSGGATER